MFRNNHLLYVVVIIVCSGIIAINYTDLFTQQAKQCRVTGGEDHSITLSDAVALTANFQRQMTPGQPVGGYFGEDAVLAILNQEGAVGLRYYYAKNDGGTSFLILVGVNEEGDDLVDGLLAERSGLCPPFCSGENALNNPAFRYSANF